MPASTMSWKDLPALPEALAGQCVGTSNGWLIVAGGSLWSAPPWTGGSKTWSDRVYGLRAGAVAWKFLGHLPRPSGYAAAIQWEQAFLCLGGQDATQIYRSVLRINVDAQGAMHMQTLPDLPQPLTNATGAIAGKKLFLFGGQHSLQPQDTAHEALVMDPERSTAWHALTVPWRHARILPAVSSCGEEVYVAGGADLSLGRDGSAERTYLRDAWRYGTSHDHWSKLPDLPTPVTAAPSACTPAGEWVILGGDDGELAQHIQQLRDLHPGFRKEILEYDSKGQQWQPAGHLPLSLVTTNAVLWNGSYVIAGGENQPGHRSPRVIQLPLSAIPPL